MVVVVVAISELNVLRLAVFMLNLKAQCLLTCCGLGEVFLVLYACWLFSKSMDRLKSTPVRVRKN